MKQIQNLETTINIQCTEQYMGTTLEVIAEEHQKEGGASAHDDIRVLAAFVLHVGRRTATLLLLPTWRMPPATQP